MVLLLLGSLFSLSSSDGCDSLVILVSSFDRNGMLELSFVTLFLKVYVGDKLLNLGMFFLEMLAFPICIEILPSCVDLLILFLLFLGNHHFQLPIVSFFILPCRLGGHALLIKLSHALFPLEFMIVKSG